MIKIRAVTEMCGDERGFVAILHPSTAEMSLKIAKSKLEKIIIDTRIFTRGIYKGKLISIYKNGKITIKDVDNKEIATKIFYELVEG
ncbi:MAG: hypothetical protein RXR31_07720 [Thermoproteota archaeon]